MAIIKVCGREATTHARSADAVPGSGAAVPFCMWIALSSMASFNGLPAAPRRLQAV
jgi:hypothetical protein